MYPPPPNPAQVFPDSTPPMGNKPKRGRHPELHDWGHCSIFSGL